MLTLKTSTLFPSVNNILKLTWLSDTDYSFYRLEYSLDGDNWYIIVSAISGYRNHYDWLVPQNIIGNIQIKLIGYRDTLLSTALIATSSTIQIFTPTTLTGDIKPKLIEGDFIVDTVSADPIQSVQWIDKNHYIYTTSSAVRTYKVNDTVDIDVYPPEKGSTWAESVVLALNKINDELDYTVPVCKKNGVSSVFIKKDDNLVEYDIVLLDRLKEQGLTCVPEGIQHLARRYIPKSAYCDINYSGIIYSAYLPDNYIQLETDENGMFESKSEIFPVSNVGIGIGLEKMKTKKAGYTYIYKTQDNEFIGYSDTSHVVIDSSSYIQSSNLEEFVCEKLDTPPGDRYINIDLVSDEVVPDTPTGDTGTLHVKTYKSAAPTPLPGVSFTVNLETSLTDNEGTVTFTGVPIGKYKIVPLLSGGYKFTPNTVDVEITKDTDTNIYFVGVQHYKINVTVKDQFGDKIKQPVSLEIRRSGTLVLGYPIDIVGEYTSGYDFKSGAYTVSVSREGAVFYPDTAFVMIGNEDTVNIEFTTELHTISGNIKDLDGNPVTDADINIYQGLIDAPEIIFDINEIIRDDKGEPFETYKSDIDGNYKIAVFPGLYTLRADKEVIIVDNFVSWLQSYWGFPDDAPQILLIKELLNDLDEAESQENIKDIIGSMLGGLSEEEQTDLQTALLSAEVKSKLYFLPEQRHINNLSVKHTSGQDFVQERTFSIEGKIYNGASTTEGVGGIGFVVIASDLRGGSGRMLYTQRRFRVNTLFQSEGWRGIIGSGLYKATDYKGTPEFMTGLFTRPDGSYKINSVLPGEYWIIPVKSLDFWEKVYDEDGRLVGWDWASDVNPTPYNLGYAFLPGNAYGKVSVNSVNEEGVFSMPDIYAYTQTVTCNIKDSLDNPTTGIKTELVGGEYVFEIVGQMEDGTPLWDKVAKVGSTDIDGNVVYKSQYPIGEYIHYFYKKGADGNYYTFSGEGISPTAWVKSITKLINIPDNVRNNPVEGTEQDFLTEFIVTSALYDMYTISGEITDNDTGDKLTNISIVATCNEEDYDYPSYTFVNEWGNSALPAEQRKPVKLMFKGTSDIDGLYNLTVLTQDYVVDARSHLYKFTPEKYVLSVVDNLSDKDFFGDRVTLPSEELLLSYYNVSGTITDIWTDEPKQGITVKFVVLDRYWEKYKCGSEGDSITVGETDVYRDDWEEAPSINTITFSTFITDESGRYTMRLSPGIYLIYVETSDSYNAYPDVPYCVKVEDTDINGIDFQIIPYIKIVGIVKYANGEPVRNTPVLLNESHSKVCAFDYTDHTFLWEYDTDVYRPSAKYNKELNKIVIANEGKHTVDILNMDRVRESSYGELIPVNSMPGLPEYNLNKGIFNPVDANLNVRDTTKVVLHGDNVLGDAERPNDKQGRIIEKYNFKDGLFKDVSPFDLIICAAEDIYQMFSAQDFMLIYDATKYITSRGNSDSVTEDLLCIEPQRIGSVIVGINNKGDLVSRIVMPDTRDVSMLYRDTGDIIGFDWTTFGEPVYDETTMSIDISETGESIVILNKWAIVIDNDKIVLNKG